MLHGGGHCDSERSFLLLRAGYSPLNYHSFLDSSLWAAELGGLVLDWGAPIRMDISFLDDRKRDSCFSTACSPVETGPHRIHLHSCELSLLITSIFGNYYSLIALGLVIGLLVNYIRTVLPVRLILLLLAASCRFSCSSIDTGAHRRYEVEGLRVLRGSWLSILPLLKCTVLAARFANLWLHFLLHTVVSLHWIDCLLRHVVDLTWGPHLHFLLLLSAVCGQLMCIRLGLIECLYDLLIWILFKNGGQLCVNSVVSRSNHWSRSGAIRLLRHCCIISIWDLARKSRWRQGWVSHGHCIHINILL